MSDKNLEKDVNQTGDFFKYLHGSMKLSMPVWDDFIQRGQKFQRSLEQSIVTFNSFLDGFAKLAELATNSKGATHEIGISLTNMVRWQKALELKIRELNFSLSTKVLTPVSHRVDEWKKQLSSLDKDHDKEMSRPLKEAKDLIKTTIKAQKTLENKRKKRDKQVPNLQTQLEQCQKDTDLHIADVEQKEKVHMSRIMVEERVWFTTLINAFMTVLDQLVTVGSDFDRLPNLMADLKESTNSPSILPEAKRDFIEEWQIPSVNSPRLKLGNSSNISHSTLNMSGASNIPRVDSAQSFDTNSELTISSPIMDPTPPPPQVDPPSFSGYVQNPANVAAVAPPPPPQQQTMPPSSCIPPEDHYDVPVLPPQHVSVSPSQVSLVSNGSHNSSESNTSSTRSASPQSTRNSLPALHHHGYSGGHHQQPTSTVQPPQPAAQQPLYQSPMHSYPNTSSSSSQYNHQRYPSAGGNGGHVHSNDLSFVNRADMTPAAMKYVPATLPRPRKDSNSKPTAPKPVRTLQQSASIQHEPTGYGQHGGGPPRLMRQSSLPEQDNTSDGEDDENLSAFALALKQKKLRKTINMKDRSNPNI